MTFSPPLQVAYEKNFSFLLLHVGVSKSNEGQLDDKHTW